MSASSYSLAVAASSPISLHIYHIANKAGVTTTAQERAKQQWSLGTYLGGLRVLALITENIYSSVVHIHTRWVLGQFKLRQWQSHKFVKTCWERFADQIYYTISTQPLVRHKPAPQHFCSYRKSFLVEQARDSVLVGRETGDHARLSCQDLIARNFACLCHLPTHYLPKHAVPQILEGLCMHFKCASRFFVCMRQMDELLFCKQNIIKNVMQRSTAQQNKTDKQNSLKSTTYAVWQSCICSPKTNNKNALKKKNTGKKESRALPHTVTKNYIWQSITYRAQVVTCRIRLFSSFWRKPTAQLLLRL